MPTPTQPDEPTVPPAASSLTLIPLWTSVLTFALGLDMLDVLLEHVSFGRIPAFALGVPLLAFGLIEALRRLAGQFMSYRQEFIIVGVGCSANVLTLAFNLARQLDDSASLVTHLAVAVPLVLAYVGWGVFWLRYWAKS